MSIWSGREVHSIIPIAQRITKVIETEVDILTGAKGCPPHISGILGVGVFLRQTSYD